MFQSKKISILSYNVGHLYLTCPRKHYLGKEDKLDVFFNVSDLPWIIEQVKHSHPDVVFFQELNSSDDLTLLQKKLGFKYSSFLVAKHLKGFGTGILHNFENARDCSLENEHISLDSFCVSDVLFTNVHLNPFSKDKRAQQIKYLLEHIKLQSASIQITAGDFNLSKWLGMWTNNVDKKSYQNIVEEMKDVTKSIFYTHRVGYKFDFIFTSKDVVSTNLRVYKKTKGALDHFPVSVDVEI